MLRPTEEPIRRQPAATFRPLALLRLLRLAGRSLLAQAALHGQMARQEWAQEKARLLQLLLAGLLGFACLLTLLLLLSTLLLALSWDTPYRLVTLVGLLLGYALGCALAWQRIRTLMARGDMSFAATREELAADVALLKSKL